MRKTRIRLLIQHGDCEVDEQGEEHWTDYQASIRTAEVNGNMVNFEDHVTECSRQARNQTLIGMRDIEQLYSKGGNEDG